MQGVSGHLSQKIASLVFLMVVSPSTLGQATHSRSEQSPQIIESVSTTARCKEGIIVSHSYRTSGADVKITEEGGEDCTAEGCRAWAVTAKSDSSQSFHIAIDLVCTGDGKDAEIDRIMEAIRNPDIQWKEKQ